MEGEIARFEAQEAAAKKAAAAIHVPAERSNVVLQKKAHVAATPAAKAHVAAAPAAHVTAKAEGGKEAREREEAKMVEEREGEKLRKVQQ
eukprot:1608344-Rhodomonas_salina.1